MRRIQLVAAAVCTGMLVSGVATASAQSPAQSPAAEQIATPHDDGRGRLVSAKVIQRMSRQQVAGYLADHDLDPAAARHGVDLYLVTYRTVGVDGRRTTASTLSVLPRTSARTLPTVTWLHGTRVFRGYTGSMDDNLDRAASVLFAASGYATVAPDYLGLGVGPGNHPYMLSKPTITATVDALRATGTLASKAHHRMDHRVLLAGFSQGGQASMIVGRALQNDVSEFGLRGIAAIAGPHAIRAEELPAALDGRLDGISASLYLAYAATSWNRYHHLYDNPSEVFRAPYDKVVEDLFDGSHPEEDVIAGLPDTPQKLFTDQYLAKWTNPTGALRRVLEANDDPCQWRPRVPVRLYAGTLDRDVLFSNSEHCQATLREHGTRDSKLVNVGDVDHFASPVIALPQILSWFGTLR